MTEITSNRKFILFVLLVILLPVFFILNLTTGVVELSPTTIWKVLFRNDQSDILAYNVVFNIRLPQTITALLAGIGLSIGGLQMQTLFRNPLAEPSILGISSGASLGVALLTLASGSLLGVPSKLGNFSDISLSLAAFTGAIGTLMIILGFSTLVRNHVSLLITGLMLGYLISALVGVLQFFSYKDELQAYVMWGFGNFSGVGWRRLPLFTILILAGTLFSFILVKPMNGWLLGENYAKNLGVNIPVTRLGLILCTGLLTAVVTAFTGPIAFIGLAVPHLCRGLFRTWDHKALMPAVILTGSILALVCNLIVRLPWFDNALPVNAVTAIIGAPVVIWVIIRQKSLTSSNVTD